MQNGYYIGLVEEQSKRVTRKYDVFAACVCLSFSVLLCVALLSSDDHRGVWARQAESDLHLIALRSGNLRRSIFPQTSSGLSRPPQRIVKVPEAGAIGSGDAAPDNLPPRPPYALSGEPRPRWRGAACGWLHRTGAGYLIPAGYLAAAYFLLGASRSASALAFRALAAAATMLNVFVSEGYHNPDLRHPGAGTVSAATEANWIKADFFGISLVITSLLWLWASNTGWAGCMRTIGVLSGVATGIVALFAAAVPPEYSGGFDPRIGVKLTLAVQFVGLMGYLMWVILSSPVLAAKFGLNTLIYLIYVPGFILYALKWPKREDFGYHEYFHTSVLSGHLASMILDMRHILISGI